MTRFEIPGAPQGKGRPRVTIRGGKPHAYTPKKTVDYEQQIRQCYLAARGKYYDKKPLAVSVIAIYPIPKAFCKADKLKALMGKLAPQTKPDMDNIIKAVLDSLNGVAYADDKQVVELFGKSYYGAEAKVVVTISEVIFE